MPGVRLHHPSLRNCVYTLIHEGRPLPAPRLCPACGLTEFHKTYHLVLDGVGDVVVSEVAYAHLKDAGLGELRVLGEVRSPPPQIVGFDGQPLLVVSRENGNEPLRR